MNSPDSLLATGPADLTERIDAQTRHALATADRARAWAEQVRLLRGSGAWGGVRAEVDVHGVLVDVRLERPGGVGTGGGAAEQVLRAVRGAYGAALADVHAHLSRRALSTWGDDPLARRIIAESSARFGLEASAARAVDGCTARGGS